MGALPPTLWPEDLLPAHPLPPYGSNDPLNKPKRLSVRVAVGAASDPAERGGGGGGGAGARDGESRHELRLTPKDKSGTHTHLTPDPDPKPHLTPLTPT